MVVLLLKLFLWSRILVLYFIEQSLFLCFEDRSYLFEVPFDASIHIPIVFIRNFLVLPVLLVLLPDIAQQGFNFLDRILKICCLFDEGLHRIIVTFLREFISWLRCPSSKMQSTQSNIFYFSQNAMLRSTVPSYFFSCLRQQFSDEPEFTLRSAKFFGRKLISSMNVLHMHYGHWILLLMWSPLQQLSQSEWPQKISSLGAWADWLNWLAQ